MERGIGGVSKFLLLAPFFLLSMHQGLCFEEENQIDFAYQSLVNPETNTIDTVFFAPKDGKKIERTLIGLIQASTSIFGALFLLNNRSIINALIEAHQRGAHIHLIVDQGAMNSGTNAIYDLPRAGIPLHLFNSSSRFRPLMHNKYFIFEDSFYKGQKIVASGSMNITQSGLHTNQDNVTFRDSNAIIAEYEANLMSLNEKTETLLIHPQEKLHRDKRHVYYGNDTKKKKRKKMKQQERKIFWEKNE